MSFISSQIVGIYVMTQLCVIDRSFHALDSEGNVYVWGVYSFGDHSAFIFRSLTRTYYQGLYKASSVRMLRKTRDSLHRESQPEPRISSIYPSQYVASGGPMYALGSNI